MRWIFPAFPLAIDRLKTPPGRARTGSLTPNRRRIQPFFDSHAGSWRRARKDSTWAGSHSSTKAMSAAGIPLADIHRNHRS
jgi:hypothetical protein